MMLKIKLKNQLLHNVSKCLLKTCGVAPPCAWGAGSSAVSSEWQGLGCGGDRAGGTGLDAVGWWRYT